MRKRPAIIYLTREPSVSLHLTAGKAVSNKNSAPVYQTEGIYFLRLKIVTTRVITAQSIITNVKRSLYVTIGTSLLSFVRWPA